MTWVKWILISVYFEIVLVSTQNRSTICAERTIGSEISLVHLMVLLGDVGEVEVRFSPFRDSVNLDARWCTICAERAIVSEVLLGAPDGTPR